MTLHLTRDEADRLTADGRVVLFRAGELEHNDHPLPACGDPGCEEAPPAEFVEAAQRPTDMAFNRDTDTCTNCGGFCALYEAMWGKKCPDCLDGKRRIAAVVPCPNVDSWGDPCEGAYEIAQSEWRPCPLCDGERGKPGFVTVATVVVTWGPLPTVRPGIDVHNPPIDCIALTRLGLVLHIVGERPVGVADYPPDVDPATLVGQYALGIEVAS